MVLKALEQIHDQECQMPENTFACETSLPINKIFPDIDIPNFYIDNNVIIEEIVALNNSTVVEFDKDIKQHQDKNSNNEDGIENVDNNEDNGNTCHPENIPLQDEESDNNDSDKNSDDDESDSKNDPDYIQLEDENDTTQEELQDNPAGS